MISVTRKGGIQQQALGVECGSLKPQLSKVGLQNQDQGKKICQGGMLAHLQVKEARQREIKKYKWE